MSGVNRLFSSSCSSGSERNRITGYGESLRVQVFRKNRRKFSANTIVLFLLALLTAKGVVAAGDENPIITEGGIFEWTVESHKAYADPFNDVDVDVLFRLKGQNWRVPTFWRGENRWTVRFAPPVPGDYSYRLESTDETNPDLNGHANQVTIAAYSGSNPLFKRGTIRVSANRRYFEQADGTPFYWLGDTWWTGLSDRLPWEGFQQLAQDRRSKGFTVVQICAGLIPSNEEQAPVDPGFCNEGGCVWDTAFKRINPKYFDYADRRIRYLLVQGLTPAIVGGWRQVLAQMGVEKMKKHWRYVIARYGAYPVFWILGGEVYDPPASSRSPVLVFGTTVLDLNAPGWTEVARYIRNADPYHHPLSVHEVDPPFDSALRDEALTDFDLFQAGHRGEPSIATEIALLNKHYARTTISKPLVVGEIGYEKLAGKNDETYQRAAFWLAMLNGAAGFTYGNISTAEGYSADKPFQRLLLSPYSWEEGMSFPGASQVAMGADLLRKYPWWKIAPHPQWVTPRGTTLLEPNNKITGFDIDLIAALASKNPPPDEDLPLGEWHDRRGNWRLPYAAGVPREIRLIYFPYSLLRDSVPVVHGLEVGVRYHAYYWEPTLGIRVNLGRVESVTAGEGKVDIEGLDRKLYDARGKYRGELSGPGWDSYGTHQRIVRDSYEPEKPPFMGDWLLVLEAET
jgi:hypothetical protein